MKTFIIILHQLYNIGENKNSFAISIGFVVFAIFLVIMLWSFNVANNLTVGAIFISICMGLFAGFLVTAASMNY